MPDNKLVIRRLPPSMDENDFVKQISPLPSHDYFCYFEANSGLGTSSYSRAYINFLNPDDMSIFRERFDNYIFLDKDGNEFPAVVEQSLWHKSPKNGPFYKESDTTEGAKSNDDTEQDTIDSTAVNDSSSTILKDPDFLNFMEKLCINKKRLRNSPIQILENNLDALTNSSNASSSGNKDNTKVITPLIRYINQKRNMKGNRKGK